MPLEKLPNIYDFRFDSSMGKTRYLIDPKRWLNQTPRNFIIFEDFQAFPRLSKGVERLLRTFVSFEAPLLHPQVFRSIRGASAPKKNAYKQKAPALQSYIDFFNF